MSDLHPILLGRYYRAYRAARGLYVQPLAQQRQAEKNSLRLPWTRLLLAAAPLNVKWSG